MPTTLIKNNMNEPRVLITVAPGKRLKSREIMGC